LDVVPDELPHLDIPEPRTAYRGRPYRCEVIDEDVRVTRQTAKELAHARAQQEIQHNYPGRSPTPDYVRIDDLPNRVAQSYQPLASAAPQAPQMAAQPFAPLAAPTLPAQPQMAAQLVKTAQLRAQPGKIGRLIRMTYMKAPHPRDTRPPGLVQLMDGNRQVYCFDLFITLIGPYPGNNMPGSCNMFWDANIPFQELKLTAMPKGAVFELEFA
jgi:hypothetical protein